MFVPHRTGASVGIKTVSLHKRQLTQIQSGAWIKRTTFQQPRANVYPKVASNKSRALMRYLFLHTQKAGYLNSLKRRVIISTSAKPE